MFFVSTLTIRPIGGVISRINITGHHIYPYWTFNFLIHRDSGDLFHRLAYLSDISEWMYIEYRLFLDDGKQSSANISSKKKKPKVIISRQILFERCVDNRFIVDMRTT